MARPSFAVDEDNPGSDVAAETAAALAAAAILFLDQDTTYAEQCLGHAIDLLEMAILYRGKYDDSVESAKTFYRNCSLYIPPSIYGCSLTSNDIQYPHFIIHGPSS